MKKFLLSAAIAICAATSLIAAPKAVVFDWGDVMGFVDRSIFVNFVCGSMQCSKGEFESVILENKKAVQAGKPEVDVWLEFAEKRKIKLPEDWGQQYFATLKKAFGADPNMYKLVDQIKETGMRVGLLSNVDNRGRHLLQKFGFYEPFDPCILSSAVGLAKPDPRIYELLLKTLDLPGEDVVFIDDKENVEAAKQLGIDAIHFQSFEQLSNELSKRHLLKL